MGRNFCEVKIPQNFWEKLSRMTSKDPSKYSSLEGVLKTSFMFVFKRRLLQKTSSRRLDQDKHIRLGHTSSRRLQDVFKTFSRRFQDVFKTSCKMSSRHIQDVFKTFWRRLQDVFKTSSRRLAKTSSRCLEKRLQDIFKTSCKDIFKTFSSCIIKLNCSC